MTRKKKKRGKERKERGNGREEKGWRRIHNRGMREGKEV